MLFNPVMAADGGCGLSVAGSGTFRLLRAADGALKAAPCALAKREPQNYTAHAWLPDSARSPCMTLCGSACVARSCNVSSPTGRVPANLT